MYDLGYFLAKIKYRLGGKNKEVINNYFRSKGMKIGEQVNICSNINTSEAYLITIGNDVTISNDVQLITHDNSVSKVLIEMSDSFGQIIIGDNCFIGARSILMYGVELHKNIIVASGSVVTKSFNESNIIIGGNPAKKIGSWQDFRHKSIKHAFNINGLNKEQKYKLICENAHKLVKK